MFGKVTHVLIAPHVDPASLFQRAADIFAGVLQIERVVAAGEERALFVARDATLKRRVALRAHLKPGTTGRTWFERESELLAAVDHRAIRPVYAAGQRDGWSYRVSKWIEGESLLDAVARGPRPIPSVLQLARDIAGVLEYAHAQRIVIRRIVPTNVMIDGADRAIITDLRFSNPCLDVASKEPDPAAEPFLAPEVRDGRAGEPASDVYTAGALLYFAVTGQAPAAEPAAVVAPSAIRPACPQVLERVILRALQDNPAARYLTSQEMGDDLLSDLGDYDLQAAVPPPLRGASAEDSRAWEKRLRRALGDDYELLRELGVGGFGRVYLVRDLALEREVALKVLHPYLTSDPAVLERFRREAQLAAQLNHPHIVSIYETSGRGGLLWYTMAYVRGVSVAHMIRTGGPAPVLTAARMLRESLEALEHAHARNVVHRDLKPENMLIEESSGSVRITDFGLAIAVRGTGSSGGVASHSGTPEFAAPEQLLGERVDHRADLYALACVGYFLLSGQAPFGAGAPEEIIARQTVESFPDLETMRDDVPQDLNEILARAAARRPEERFPTAKLFREELEDALRPWWAKSIRRILRTQL